MDSEIHDALTLHGFKLMASEHVCYEGSLSVNRITFDITISDIDPNFVKLPVVKLRNRPAELPPTLPHVEAGDKLCFIDPGTIVLDPINPRDAIAIMVLGIKNALAEVADARLEGAAITHEFSQYWAGEERVIWCGETGTTCAKLYARTGPDGEKSWEHLVGVDEQDFQHWKKTRATTQDQARELPALVIRINQVPAINCADEWPKKCLAELYQWLQIVDNASASKLLAGMVSILSRPASGLIVVLYTDTEIFGFRIHYRPSLRIRRDMQSPTKAVRQLILGKKHLQEFKRLRVVDCSNEGMRFRTLGNKGLIGLNVALIGCGSVGGHVARMLVQSGAGLQNGSLTLFDGDSLTPSNLGRHTLGLEHIFEQKSVALAQELTRNATSHINVTSRQDFLLDESPLSGYDILINATGDESFGIALSRRYRNEQKVRAPLIHGWIEAAGVAVRSLLDNKQGMCLRCLRSSSNFSEYTFPLGDEKLTESLPKVNRRCGESFTPYGPDAAVCAAGLIVRSALDFAAGKSKPSLRHISLREDIKHLKPKSPGPTKDCPCCQSTT